MALTQPFWITDRLAISPRPRGGDWLDDEIRAWAAAGIRVVVSALTESETQELELGMEESRCQAAGIEFISLPIPDCELPPSRDPVVALAQRLRERIEAGTGVLVHCRQGIGRSTIIAATSLIAMGIAPPEALAAIERARGRPVPDTREQRQWILDLRRA